MSERPRPNEPGPRDSIPTNEQKEQWVDSMLDALYGHTESHSQDLVTQGMKRLESAQLNFRPRQPLVKSRHRQSTQRQTVKPKPLWTRFTGRTVFG